MQHCTTHIVQAFEQIFNPEICHRLARKHRFIQRSSSIIQGHEFIKALILPSDGLSEDSLNGLCQRLKEFNPEVDISASALAQRINKPATVALMKDCMQRALSLARSKMIKQYSCLEGPLSHFINVYLQDSTVFEVNKHLSTVFEGTKRGGKKGGSSCKAQVKIDLIHNCVIGEITDAQIYEGKRPDQALAAKILDVIQEGDLAIRDLGYFKLEVLQKIQEAAAYFLTRLPSHVKIYLNPTDKNPVDLAKHLSQREHLPVSDIKVWAGDIRLPVRLVAYKVPKEVLNQRLRRAHKGAKEMGRVLSKAKLDLLQFSLFITNVPEELLSAEIIGTVYRLRWEIELIFKQWKSLLKIDILKGVCRYRVEALIWSRLCMVIIVASITSMFMNLAKKYLDRELSPEKLIKYLMRNNRLYEAVKNSDIENLVNEMIQDLRRLLKEMRSRTTMRERVISLKPYYEWVECA
jgi:hypothetical protein